jgi:ATP-dependent DNA helicase RecG
MDKMNAELLETLHGLIENWEDEVVEFKEASNGFKRDEIGEYFSAISNEANLKGLQYGWLVFGVNNKSKAVVGSNYRDARGLETLKHEIAQNTTGGISFIDIFEVYDASKRVVMFKIPAAVVAIPTAWKGVWYGRDGESLGKLSLEELDRIRSQVRRDWSKQLIDGSSLKHLDAEALAIARSSYKVKLNKSHIGKEIDAMTDEEFLTKIRLIEGGKLTNAAIVLLGSPDYDDLISPPARAMWRLHGSNDADLDYREFRIPFITVVDRLFGMVRKLTYRYIPNNKSLTTVETEQYDESLCRELLNNCIAHMDYTIGGRIYLDEFEDRLAVSNPGDFLPGNIAKVLKPEYTSPYYRNQLLADAMVLFNMIDSAAMGIRKVYRTMSST